MSVRWAWFLKRALIAASAAIVAGFGLGVAWAADHYIDDRINMKLAGVVEKLAKIEKELVEIKTILRGDLRNPETP